jgi:hypothetical protein
MIRFNSAYRSSEKAIFAGWVLGTMARFLLVRRLSPEAVNTLWQAAENGIFRKPPSIEHLLPQAVRPQIPVTPVR